jgi:hypothetical protein
MKTYRQSNETPDLMDQLYQSIEDGMKHGEEIETLRTDDETGNLTIRTTDGRTYELQLWEIITY